MKQRRGIRRIVIRAGIFLLLGAIVNIAVAWGAVLWSTEPRPDHEDDALGLPVAVPTDWPPLQRCAVGSSFWLTVEWHDPPSVPDDFETYVLLQQLKSGLPWRSLSWIRAEDDRSWGREEEARGPFQKTEPVLSLWQRGFAMPRWLDDDTTRMPMDVLWPGFAINTLFYAAILWLLLALPGALRRWRRIKRGLCPACAYPVGTSDLCTECGMPVTPPPPERKRLKAA